MRVAIASILLDNDRILLLQRRDTNTWALPGGKLEENETVVDGAKRELLEETGIEGSLPIFMCYTDDFIKGAPFVTLYFRFLHFEGIPVVKEPSKHITIGWYHRTSLPTLYVHTEDALKKIGWIFRNRLEESEV